MEKTRPVFIFIESRLLKNTALSRVRDIGKGVNEWKEIKLIFCWWKTTQHMRD